MESCAHVDLDDDGRCLDCGIEMGVAPAPLPREGRSRASQLEPLRTLEELDLPREIKSEAARMREMVPLRSQKEQNEHLFYCVYWGARNAGLPQVPHHIEKLIGLRKPLSDATLRHYDRHNPYRFQRRLEAVDYVPRYIERLSSPDPTEHLLALSLSLARCVEGRPRVRNLRPQDVAAACVHLAARELHFKLTDSDESLLAHPTSSRLDATEREVRGSL